MIISFGWTTPALLACLQHQAPIVECGCAPAKCIKCVTRRDWNPKHAAKFEAGHWVDAWNTSPRNVHMNPHKVATIRLISDPYLEHTAYAPALDWQDEGFAYLTKLGLKVGKQTPDELWDEWAVASRELYVVRFEVVEYLEGPLMTHGENA